MEKKEEQLRKAARKALTSYKGIKRDQEINLLVGFAKSEAAKQYHSSNDSVEGKPFDIDGHWAHIWKKAGVMDVIDFLLEMDKKYNLQKQQESDAWISVEDRLPKHKERVLCFPKGHPFYRMVEADYEDYTSQDEQWFIESFSHWMPSPKSPTIQIKQ